MKINRRQVLQQSLAATTIVATAGGICRNSAAESHAGSHALIIDTHQHLWDLAKFSLPWLSTVPRLNRGFSTMDYRDAIRGLNVVQAVYMEVDVDPGQQAKEAEHVIELCRGKTSLTSAAVISGRPGSDLFPAYVMRYKSNDVIKGVRQVLHTPQITPRDYLDPRFVRGIQLLGEVNWSFDLCMRPQELHHATKLVDLCPGTRFVLDHCGNAEFGAFVSDSRRKELALEQAPSHTSEQWRRDLSELARRNNVVCKISGIIAHAPSGKWVVDDLAPIVVHCLAAFGPDRVMFGSDWPVCTLAATYRQWVDTLREIVAAQPDSEQRKLWHDNAVKFYGLS